jgi:hypothetical protein
MSKPNDSRRSSIPYWQLTRMRMIIRDRWTEIWEVVKERELWNHEINTEKTYTNI